MLRTERGKRQRRYRPLTLISAAHSNCQLATVVVKYVDPDFEQEQKSKLDQMFKNGIEATL